MEPIEQSILSIIFKNGSKVSFVQPDYYTVQQGFLVIHQGTLISHFNSDGIESFYSEITNKENI